MNDDPRKTDDQLRQITDSVSDVFSSVGKKVSGFMEDFFREEERGKFSVHADAYYTPQHFVIEAELPGVTKEDVSLQIVDHYLSLKGVKRMAKEAEQYEFVGRERLYGHFLRQLELPNDIDFKQIKAKYENGVLRVTFARIDAPADDSGKTVDID